MKIILAAIISGLLSLPVMAQVGKKGEEKPKPKNTTPAKKTATAPARKSTPAPRRSRTNNAKDESAANERTFWESIRNSTNPEDFRAYLNKYPNGEFVTLARNKISSLEAAAKPQPAVTPIPTPTPTPTPPEPKKSEESSVSLAETMNWIAPRLMDSAFTRIIKFGERDMYNVMLPMKLDSFDIEKCTLTVNGTLTNFGYKYKFIIPFSDIDPVSIKMLSGSKTYRAGLTMQTTKPSLRIVDLGISEETKTSAYFDFTSQENLNRFEKAIRHTVNLCGGKRSLF